MVTPADPGRRQFLQAGATVSAAWVLEFALPGGEAHAQPSFAPGAFLRIGADDSLTVLIGQTEMGQGISTGLAMALAEELEADWSKIRFEFATGRPEYFNRALLPTDQVTGGSRSMQAFFEPMRKAGAAAREMLKAAAAARWGVPAGECAAENGGIVHRATGRRLPFGALIAEAARQPVPSDLPLKPRSQFRVIGQSLRRLDCAQKCDGSALFGIDAKVPGMAHAAVRHAPVLGAQVQRFDAATALAQPGVIAVVPLPGAIAAVAEHYWQATRALEAVEVTFGPTSRDGYSSAQLERELSVALDAGKAVAAKPVGDAAAALASAARVVQAEYRVPYLAHATLEPINATASVTRDGCEIWAPTQAPSWAARAAAKLLDIDESRVKVHLLHAGCGFGRKGAPDAVSQAVLLSKAVGRPVKVIWSREEDTQQDFYRPANAVRFKGGLDAQGVPIALTARVAGSGPLIFNRPQAVKGGLDPMAIVGLADCPYRIEQRATESVEVTPPVRVGFWRSTSNSRNTFFLESFMDELAHAAGQDPYRFRRALLAHDPRAVAVLDPAADLGGWHRPATRGAALGIAFYHAPRWLTRVAAVVALSAGERGLHIERIVCVADSGLVVNPNLARAQLEGGIVYGLNAALYGEITLENGHVQQSNFHDYRLLRIGEVPPIAVHIIEGDEAPGSFGEIGVPAVAPALANAVFAATGKRIRNLPISREGIVIA